jgi:8-oxo-dGTP diphosphatase
MGDKSMAIGHFLAGVATVIYSPESDRYLLLRRSEHKDFGAGIWEVLTGRVDQGEGFEDALHREVHEELNITVRVTYILGTTHFYRGDANPENELVGVVYLCTVDKPYSITLSAEHAEFCWLNAQQASELLSAPDPSTQWARRVIERAEIIRPMLTEKLVSFQLDNGFEFG